MTGGYLFAGIGGFELASQRAGIKPVWSNEIDPYCCNVLRKNFSHEIIGKDIRQLKNLPYVDIISGGFPCQPFSIAGKRGGEDDNRFLWPEMLRIISEVKPPWVIGENVAGILSMENGKIFEGICTSLENEGYTVQAYNIPACGVGAWHRRERIWIIAHNDNFGYKQELPLQARNEGKEVITIGSSENVSHSNRNGNTAKLDTGTNRSKAKRGEDSNQQERETSNGKRVRSEFIASGEDVANATSKGLQNGRISQMGQSTKEQEFKRQDLSGRQWGEPEPRMGGVVTRLSDRMDGYWDKEPEGIPRVAKGIPKRKQRLEGLGNAIVPQVAYEIFKSIVASENI